MVFKTGTWKNFRRCIVFPFLVDMAHKGLSLSPSFLPSIPLPPSCSSAFAAPRGAVAATFGTVSLGARAGTDAAGLAL